LLHERGMPHGARGGGGAFPRNSLLRSRLHYTHTSPENRTG